jgi:hypothetical protein
MNSNEYNVLGVLYKAKRPLFFREISKLSKVSIGGTQQVLKDYSSYVNKRKEGRNTYYSLKQGIATFYLKVLIEAYRSQIFIFNNSLFNDLFSFLIKNNMPSLIFGSYAKGINNKDSDLDLLVLSKKKIPDHICPVELHRIDLTRSQFEKAAKDDEALIKEIRKDHIFVNKLDYFINVIGGKDGQ